MTEKELSRLLWNFAVTAHEALQTPTHDEGKTQEFEAAIAELAKVLIRKGSTGEALRDGQPTWEWFAHRCDICDVALQRGDPVYTNTRNGKLYHVGCLEDFKASNLLKLMPSPQETEK